MMNTRAEALLAVCIFALFVGHSVAAYCSTSAINRCSTPFEEKWTTASGAEVFNYYSDSQFSELCDDYDKYEDCLEPFKHDCDSTQRAVFEGEEKGFGFACGKGAEVYLRNNDCYRKDSVQRDGRECVSTFERAQRRLIDQLNSAWTSSEVHDIKERYCDAVDDVLTCVKGVLTSQCGSEIAEWQNTVDKKLLGPVMDQLDCDSDAALSHWVVVGIIVACLCSFAIVVVGCVYLCRRKKTTAGNRGQVLSHHGMAMQQQPAHVAVLPTAGLPQPPSYIEKAPSYEPTGAPSVSPSAPPAYSEVPNNYESLQQPGGIDNPNYKH